MNHKNHTQCTKDMYQVVIARFASPYEILQRGPCSIPPYRLTFLIDKSKDKNNSFPLVRTLKYIQQVYTLATPIQPTYIRICARKSKLNVRFPCHDRRSLIFGLPYTGNVLNRPFSCILKAINKPIPSYGKEERIQL
jgi:hypothetical protein